MKTNPHHELADFCIGIGSLLFGGKHLHPSVSDVCPNQKQKQEQGNISQFIPIGESGIVAPPLRKGDMWETDSQCHDGRHQLGTTVQAHRCEIVIFPPKGRVIVVDVTHARRRH